MHRAQFEFCLKSAIENEANLLLHPQVGGDITDAPGYFGLVRSFLAIRERFPADDSSCRRGEDFAPPHATCPWPSWPAKSACGSLPTRAWCTWRIAPNILLTELDRELESRGHAFCRYADDRNIYVKSKEAGERVMASITRFLADTLKLTVNAAKSAMASPWK